MTNDELKKYREQIEKLKKDFHKDNPQNIEKSNLSFEDLQQRLDADFLDRIAQYIVEIPAIRESREDVIRYWETTWESISNEAKTPKSKRLNQYLKTADFYGNFRDLQRLANYLFAFQKVFR